MARRSVEQDWVPAGREGVNLIDPEVYQPADYWIQADNVVFDPYGVTRSRPAITRLNTFVPPAVAAVESGYDFWFRSGDAWARRHLIGCNGKVLYEGGAGWVNITPAGVILLAGTLFDFAVVGNKILICNDQGSAPWYWNGITVTATVLTGVGVLNWSGCRKHRGRAWAFGDPAYPDDLSYSALGDLTTWSGADAGIVPCQEGDGDKIIAISSTLWDRLVVAKGPNLGSLHTLSGSSVIDFALAPLGSEIRLLGNRCMISLGSRILCYTDMGLYDIHMLMWQTGNVAHDFLSYIVHPWLKEVNWSLADKFSMVWAPDEHAVLINVARSGTLDTILYYHLRKGNFARWTNVDVQGLWTKRDAILRRQIIVGGTSTGYVRRLFDNTQTTDDGTPYVMLLTSPRLSLSLGQERALLAPASQVQKGLAEDAAFLQLMLFTIPTGEVPVTLSYQVDDQAPVSTLFIGPELGRPARLGIDFILGASVLGGFSTSRGLATLRKIIPEAPKGQTIQFTISSTSGQVALYGYGLRWVPTGEDMSKGTIALVVPPVVPPVAPEPTMIIYRGYKTVNLDDDTVTIVSVYATGAYVADVITSWPTTKWEVSHIEGLFTFAFGTPAPASAYVRWLLIPEA